VKHFYTVCIPSEIVTMVLTLCYRIGHYENLPMMEKEIGFLAHNIHDSFPNATVKFKKGWSFPK